MYRVNLSEIKIGLNWNDFFGGSDEVLLDSIGVFSIQLSVSKTLFSNVTKRNN